MAGAEPNAAESEPDQKAEFQKAELKEPVFEFEKGLGVRAGDEVWMVSTRHIGCGYRAPLDIYRLGPTQWDQATGDALRNSLQPNKAVYIYVHGNRMNFQDAADRGRLYYEQLILAGAPEMRFIVWSWPSDQIKGQLRDVRVKAARADFEAGLLAEFVPTVPAESPLKLIGYSYGARVISGALSNAGDDATVRRPAQTAFLAPAVDVNWLGPGNFQYGAWTRMNRLLVLFNSCDPALKRFRYSDACYQPAALGYVGPWWVGQTAGEVDSENVCCIVGKSHSELNYLNSPYLMDRLRGFFQPELIVDATEEGEGAEAGVASAADAGSGSD